MRKWILAATLALGLGAIPGTVSAAPGFASQPEMAAKSDVEQVQYDGRRFDGRRGYSTRPRYGRPGRAYGRYHGGPPRGYGRRGHYGRDRQWGRRW